MQVGKRFGRADVISVLSAVGWSVIAVWIGYQLGTLLWGGVLISPLIGFLVGRFARWTLRWAPAMRTVYCLLALYVAAAGFGLGMGLWDWAWGSQSRYPFEVIFSPVYIVLLGITISGYFILLWPLSWLNHRYVWRALVEQDLDRLETPHPNSGFTT